LHSFFTEIGPVDVLEQSDNYTVIIFKSFFDTHTALEFLKNDENYNNSQDIDKFIFRWIKKEDDIYFSNEIKQKIKKFQNLFNFNFSDNNKSNQQINSYSSNSTKMGYGQVSNFQYSENWCSNVKPNYNAYYNSWNISNSNPQSKINYIPNFNIGPHSSNNMKDNINMLNNKANSNKGKNQSNNNLGIIIKTNQIIGINNNVGSISNFNSNINGFESEDKKLYEKFISNGKYTCRFDIQIENDKEFQVARKLIGSKVNELILYLGM